jgi:hypothetical protein
MFSGIARLIWGGGTLPSEKKWLSENFPGLARAPRSSSEPPTHTVDAPKTVWAWDITWLPSTVLGHFFRL